MAGRMLETQPLLTLFLHWATVSLLSAGIVRGQTYHLDFSRPDTIKGNIFETVSSIQTAQGFITSNQPFFLSLPASEGNYKVTVTLGGGPEPSATTVKAELRRLMLEHVSTGAGQRVTRTFIVNVRAPLIEGSGESVHLKDREKTSEARAWDDKLTLQFSDSKPQVRSVDITPVTVPTIYIAGDSTSTDQGQEPFNSWGQMITRFFKPEVAIANNGESGETARSFMSEKRLDKVASMLKPGDTLLIQFGHNDQKEKGEYAGAASFQGRILQIVQTARQHGATPVLITSMNRRTFDTNGKIVNSLFAYTEAVRELAAREQVALIDLNAMSKPLYEAFGTERSAVLFAKGDATHHSDFGSYELAKCVLTGIRQAHLAIARYIVDDFDGFEPSRPDSFERFAVPQDPDTTSLKPYGN